jgi:alpha-galactosidase
LEVGVYQQNVYLALGGPTNKDHGWKHRLPPGQSFTTKPVALCHVFGYPDNAFAALTEYLRRIRRPHKDNEELGVVFNDYMNCLIEDPTEEKVMALVEPAAKAGAKFFVIDAAGMQTTTAGGNHLRNGFPEGLNLSWIRSKPED